MIVSTIGIDKEMVREIDTLCKGPDAIFPSRSDLIRHACLMFFRDFLIKDDEVKEIDSKTQVKIIEKNGDIKIYKIIKREN